MKHFRRQSVAGFTIIELMIALSVLAVLLLLSTLVLMNLGHSYVKGNNQAAAQNAARNVIDDISNQIQLGAASPNLSGELTNGNFGWVCIGTTRYNFIVGQQVSPSSTPKPGQTRHALWRDTMRSGGACSSLYDDMQQPTPGFINPSRLDSDSAPGVELIPQNMRLTEFGIYRPPSSGVDTGLYTVTVGIAYGDSDLLCVSGASLGGGSDCDSSQIASNPSGHLENLEQGGDKTTCLVGVGEQYCGVSNLSVTVARRVAGE